MELRQIFWTILYFYQRYYQQQPRCPFCHQSTAESAQFRCKSLLFVHTSISMSILKRRINSVRFQISFLELTKVILVCLLSILFNTWNCWLHFLTLQNNKIIVLLRRRILTLREKSGLLIRLLSKLSGEKWNLNSQMRVRKRLAQRFGKDLSNIKQRKFNHFTKLKIYF